MKRSTTDGQPPAPGHEDSGAPQPINPATGQHKAYWILSEEERRKGFTRPLRRSYIHRGARGPTHPLRDLTASEKVTLAAEGYVKFEPYPQTPESSTTGRYWTRIQLDSVGKGCGVLTKMNDAIAETYAREPRFYGSTFCCGCRRHLPVGEFVWDDGTEELVGS